jgi:hypothetical protein
MILSLLLNLKKLIANRYIYKDRFCFWKYKLLNKNKDNIFKLFVYVPRVAIQSEKHQFKMKQGVEIEYP